MDRNVWYTILVSKRYFVALRKESVDRNSHRTVNIQSPATSLSARRAWIEMSYLSMETLCQVSLSARRAWIEMLVSVFTNFYPAVALRKESVDRNYPGTNIILFIIASLSARRAWIEITWGPATTAVCSGRSPQGERG